MAIALDYTSPIAPAALVAEGVSDVFRYLSWLHFWGGTTHTTINPKVIQKPEFDDLTKAGIGVTLNWEFDEHDWLSGATAAQAQATEAASQAVDLGYPAGCTIVGSADFNMSRDQWLAAGRDYAARFRDVIRASGFRPGVYGPWDVLTWCRDEVGYDMFWQAGMSTSWSGGRNANSWPGAHVRQRDSKTVGGVSADWNEILNPSWGQCGGGTMPLTDDDVAKIWAYKVGGPANHRDASFALSDVRDQVLAGSSSFDGQQYWLVKQVMALVAGQADASKRLDAALAAIQALASAGTNVDVAAVLDAVHQVGVTESTTVASLQVQIQRLHDQLAAAAQAETDALKAS